MAAAMLKSAYIIRALENCLRKVEQICFLFIYFSEVDMFSAHVLYAQLLHVMKMQRSMLCEKLSNC